MKIFIPLLLFLGSYTTQAQVPDTSLSDAQKIYGLSRFWQEANYNYAYFSNVPQLNWDSAYQAYIPKVLATRNVYEYYRVMMRFCALLKDGHTNVWFPAYIAEKRSRRSFGDIKLELQNIDGKLIVVNNAAATKDRVPIGSEITEVNNLPVKTYMEEYVRPYISQSASYIIDDWSADYLLDGFNGDTIRIGERRIRFDGIDAPERGKSCGSLDIYGTAGEALRTLIGSQPVSCTITDTPDQHEREIAQCSVGGVDINSRMVATGMARDWPRYSGGEYADEEATARAAGLGIWGDSCPADLWDDRDYSR